MFATDHVDAAITTAKLQAASLKADLGETKAALGEALGLALLEERETDLGEDLSRLAAIQADLAVHEAAIEFLQAKRVEAEAAALEESRRHDSLKAFRATVGRLREAAVHLPEARVLDGRAITPSTLMDHDRARVALVQLISSFDYGEGLVVQHPELRPDWEAAKEEAGVEVPRRELLDLRQRCERRIHLFRTRGV